MYLTVHTPTSLIIGTLISNPLLAFILAFVFHLLWDVVPHDAKFIDEDELWQKKIKFFSILALIDFLLIFVLLFLLFKYQKINFTCSIISAFIGGVLPDILWGFNMLTKRKINILNKYYLFHNNVIHKLINKKIYISPIKMIFVQTIVLLITLLVYLKLI